MYITEMDKDHILVLTVNNETIKIHFSRDVRVGVEAGKVVQLSKEEKQEEIQDQIRRR